MKRRFFSGFIFLLFCLFGLLVDDVYAQSVQDVKKRIVKITGEHIQEYEVQILLERDAVLKVKERIRYSFNQSGRRGIYRDIPFIFEDKDGKKYKIKISDIKVFDERGSEYKKKIFEKDKTLRIRIGDPDVYVSGIKEYNIIYSLQGGVLYRSDYNQVLFNLIGNYWNVPILEARGVFEFGFPADLQKIEAECFVGRLFSRSSEDCRIEKGENRLEFQISRILNPFEGATIEIRFPKKWVDYNPAEEYLPLSENLWFQVLSGAVVIIVFIFAFYWYVVLPIRIYLEWKRSGRDPDIGLGKVRAWFSPPKTSSGRRLSPLEVGALVDESLNNEDIAALIVDLARRGYLKIEEADKGWSRKSIRLISRKTADENLFDFERFFLNKIFAFSNSVYVYDISFSMREYNNWVKQIYDHLVKEGFIQGNPIRIRERYNWLGFFSVLTINLPLFTAVLFFGMHMARKTKKGVEVKLMAEGFREFLKTQKRKIKFAAEKNILFDELLPYSISLGVLEDFVEIFPKRVYADAADWYSGSSDLASSLGRLTNLSSKVVYSGSTVGSYGGGFSGSGGGVGGVGGGSW